jgi:hypothetical protein
MRHTFLLCPYEVRVGHKTRAGRHTKREAGCDSCQIHSEDPLRLLSRHGHYDTHQQLKTSKEFIMVRTLMWASRLPQSAATMLAHFLHV